MSIASIGAICGVSKQRVSQILKQSARAQRETPTQTYATSYDAQVAYVRKVIPERGNIWNGCRPSFERGEYNDPTLRRMLDEGVIVPHPDPRGGYVLPKKVS
jgi:hypothetical protein